MSEESESVDSRLFGLIALTTLFGIGHHIDHIIRGNHVGWPLIPEVTTFTFSLLFYPLIVAGLYLTFTKRVGASYWCLLSAAGFILISVVHFGPFAVEPPHDIIEPHTSVWIGYFAIAWLLGLLSALLTTAVYSARSWRLSRNPYAQ